MPTRPDLVVHLPVLADGGVEAMFAGLVGEWRRSLDVEYLVGRRKAGDQAWLPPGIGIESLDAAGTFAGLPGMVRYFRRRRPRAVLTALPHNNIVATLARALSGVDVRLVLSEHNTMSERVRGSGSWRYRIVPMLARLTYPRADRVIAVSRGVADDLVAVTGIAPERVAMIHNPVRTNRVDELAREACEHPWLTGDGPPVVLGIGRLERQKDFPTLIRAFARLRATCPVRLVILGEGSEREALLRLVGELGLADDVDLPGYRPNPFAYLARADLFVLSSAWEGFGNVIVEALACALPVVATDCRSGPAEILCGGRYGGLVPVGDAEALSTAMAATLAAPPPRELLLARAAEFRLEHVAEEYLRVLFPNGV